MSDFYKTRKFKRFLYSPLVLVPLAFAVFFLGTSVWDIYTKDNETNLKRERQVKELEELESRAAALSAEIERLSTERGREEEIRSKFEVAKEGEHLIVIIDPEEEKEVLDIEKKKGLWRRFLDLF